MDKAKRIRIYLLVAVSIFLINLFNVDFDNLKWADNKTEYINMIDLLYLFFSNFYTKVKTTTNKLLNVQITNE